MGETKRPEGTHAFSDAEGKSTVRPEGRIRTPTTKSRGRFSVPGAHREIGHEPGKKLRTGIETRSTRHSLS